MVVVCDATCLERNLNLVLQVLEITPRTVVCVNLLDEAARKGIHIDLEGLEKALGVPVVGTTARSGRGLEGITALSAGDISVRREAGSGGGAALIERALALMAPFCRDEGFVFRGVSG